MKHGYYLKLQPGKSELPLPVLHSRPTEKLYTLLEQYEQLGAVYKVSNRPLAACRQRAIDKA